MLPFLKAPADAPLMTDKHEIDARYRYWLKRRTKNAKAFHDKCENFSFR
ncbi:TPA: hypothetical protein ACIYZ4_004487, partial [Escherichia coli]